MAKLINDVNEVVNEMLEGLSATQPHISLLDGFSQGIKVAFDADMDRSHVAVVSGGGSGHEPAHAAYIGRGMLTAAVCGDVFASPSTQAILAAIRHVTSPAGCLLIVKNYTGDRLNFGMALEEAKGEGLAVEMVVVADDCGVPVTGTAGRRGIAGTVFVHKVAGAAAALGLPLEEVTRLARQAAESVVSMGVALSTCTLPGVTPATEARIPVDHMELGLGIHGEPGARVSIVQSANAVVDELLSRILGPECGIVGGTPPGSRVALLVNNLGASTQIELLIVVTHAVKVLQEQKIVVERVLVGSYMTALDMNGLSLSLLLLDSRLLEIIDHSTVAPAWPKAMHVPNLHKPKHPMPAASASIEQDAPSATKSAPENKLIACIDACAAACVAAEALLTSLDLKVGDGDCGTTFARGGRAIQSTLDKCPTLWLAGAFKWLAQCVGCDMGGTSGALYQIFFAAASNAVKGVRTDDATPRHYALAFQAGASAIGKYGGALAGDRTMLDAMLPASQAALLSTEKGCSASETMGMVVEAGRIGAASTVKMHARCGRASYVNESALVDVPDPGACGVVSWLTALGQLID